jgi:hypothetical protein
MRLTAARTSAILDTVSLNKYIVSGLIYLQTVIVVAGAGRFARQAR